MEETKKTVPRRKRLTWLEREDKEKLAFKNWLAGFKEQEAQKSEVSEEEVKKAS